MNTEILLNRKIRIDIESFVAKRAHIHLFVLFLIVRTLMTFNRAVICAVMLSAVLAYDGHPVFLFACL